MFHVKQPNAPKTFHVKQSNTPTKNVSRETFFREGRMFHVKQFVYSGFFSIAAYCRGNSGGVAATF